MMIFNLPIRTQSEANLREHWAQKARRAKEHRQLARTMTPFHVTEISFPCTITLTRIAPRILDTDNLASSFKATRDGIADALEIDDGDKRITWLYDQRKGEPKEYTVEVDIQIPPLDQDRLVR